MPRSTVTRWPSLGTTTIPLLYGESFSALSKIRVTDGFSFLVVSVVSPQAITKITFNGVKVDVSRNSWGALEGTLSFETPSSVVIPKLEYWKYMDSLPEVKYSYDDVGILFSFQV